VKHGKPRNPHQAYLQPPMASRQWRQSRQDSNLSASQTQSGSRHIRSDASQSALRAIGLAHREDGIARHLCSEGGFLPQAAVSELVQGDSIPTALFLHKRHEPVACVGVRPPQCTQSTYALEHGVHFGGYRSRQYVTPVLRTPEYIHIKHQNAIPPLTEVRGSLAEIL
jgi:hypothetical protein